MNQFAFLPRGLAGSVPVEEQIVGIVVIEAEAVDETGCGGECLCVSVLPGDGVRNAGQPCFGPLNGGSHVGVRWVGCQAGFL